MRYGAHTEHASPPLVAMAKSVVGLHTSAPPAHTPTLHLAMTYLAGKVCVVTGASSGIGWATAHALARQGAIVCGAARREERLHELLTELGTERGHSTWVADVSDVGSIRSLARHVRDTYGRCDVLVNNAGFSAEVPLDEDGAVESIESVMATNFFGVVRCTAELLPLLISSAPSHVVNVASVAGRLATGAPAYTASKFAVVGWSESLHFQLEDKGVFVSSVEPGIIPTEGFPATDIAADRWLRYTMGTADGVADAIIDAIVSRKLQRTIPRWYYLLQTPRLLVPPLYRLVQRKLVAPRFRRDR